MTDSQILATEHTVLLLKPDAYELGLDEPILREVDGAGLSIVRHTVVHIDMELMLGIWPDLIGTKWVQASFEYLSSRVVDVYVLQGPMAIERMMDIKRRIRGQHAPLEKMVNILHTSKSASESADHQYMLFG